VALWEWHANNVNLSCAWNAINMLPGHAPLFRSMPGVTISIWHAMIIISHSRHFPLSLSLSLSPYILWCKCQPFWIFTLFAFNRFSISWFGAWLALRVLWFSATLWGRPLSCHDLWCTIHCPLARNHSYWLPSWLESPASVKTTKSSLIGQTFEKFDSFVRSFKCQKVWCK